MRRLARNLLIVLAVCGLVAAGVQVLLAGGDRAEYERRLAALREAGQPVEFADLGEEVPDEENARLPLCEAMAGIVPMTARRADAVVLYWNVQAGAERQPFDPAEHEDVLRLLREAARRPRFSVAPGAPDPRDRETPNLRHVGHFLSRAILGSPVGDAADLVRLKLVLAERCAEPFLIGYSVATATADSIIKDLRALQERPGFDAVAFRTAVDPVVEHAAAQRGPPPRALAEERLYGILAVTHWLAGDDFGFGRGWKDEWRHTWLGRRLVYRDAVAYLDVVQAAIDELPVGAREALAVAARIEATELDEDHTMARTIRAHIGMMLRNYTVHIANLRMIRVAMAILAHRQQRGDWPERLDDTLPLNPFTNAPFEYERTPDGARLHYPWTERERYWEFRAHPG